MPRTLEVFSIHQTSFYDWAKAQSVMSGQADIINHNNDLGLEPSSDILLTSLYWRRYRLKEENDKNND